MTYGEKITTLRKENNLTQEQFAELLNVSRQSVSKWELCIAFPDTEKLIKMSKLFLCSIDYLLKEEIESKDVNPTYESEKVKRDYNLGLLLTYLSFPPVFGFVVAIFNIIHQKKRLNNKKMLILSCVGMIVSIGLTIGMALGIIFSL